MKKNLSLLAAIFLSATAFAQPAILSGPMPGYSALNEVGIWMQVNNETDVIALHYWESGKPALSWTTSPDHYDRMETRIAKFRVSELEPGTTYEYEIILDGDTQVLEDTLRFSTQALWQYRTDPPTFHVALGSCAYINEEAYDRPGKAYGDDYGIFNAIADKRPDAMLWLGDNIYLREYDFQTYKGYLHRYNHTRQTPELQRLLRSTHHYAIWDDHDFGPNDATGSWIHKDWALKSFEAYWMNPSYGIPGIPGNTTAFRMNDIDFFLLDNRYHRTSHDKKSGTPQMLGSEQIEWLIENLKYSRAPFKMIAVGSQVLNPARVYENFAQYEQEREQLLTRIVEEKIEGVVFLTGDRHHTELRKVEVDGITIYDLTVSPLTSGVHEATNESTKNLVPDTKVAQHNFGVLEFSGERLARRMKISIFDRDGLEIWSKTIDP